MIKLFSKLAKTLTMGEAERRKQWANKARNNGIKKAGSVRVSNARDLSKPSFNWSEAGFRD